MFDTVYKGNLVLSKLTNQITHMQMGKKKVKGIFIPFDQNNITEYPNQVVSLEIAIVVLSKPKLDNESAVLIPFNIPNKSSDPVLCYMHDITPLHTKEFILSCICPDAFDTLPM